MAAYSAFRERKRFHLELEGPAYDRACAMLYTLHGFMMEREAKHAARMAAKTALRKKHRKGS